MRKCMFYGLVVCLTLCLTGWMATVSLADDDKEEAISWEQLPVAVQAKLADDKDNIKEIEKEKEGGRVVYEVELKTDGKETELTLDAEGNVLEVEQEVTLDEVPAPVKTIISALAFGGKIEKISKEIEDGKTTYEAEIQRDDLELEIEMDANGNVLKIEVGSGTSLFNN